MSLLDASPPDSTRFGLRIVRGVVDDTVPARSLAAEILASGSDVAIIRTPTRHAGGIEALARWAFPVIHADTLVYYRCDLERIAPHPPRNAGLAFARAQPSDLEPLRQLVAATFRDYRSHYHANPEFPADGILAGYAEWAESHLSREGHSLWVLRDDGRVLAFAACREGPADGEAEGVLYGVDPSAAGGGLYGDLIRHTQAHFKARGLARMKVSTQVGNFAVQKVWSREGFHMYDAIDTYHVNAMLSAGTLRVDRELVVTPAAVEAFAAVSGDRNPVHLDDAAAAANGFDGRIAHGMLVAAELSRVFGTEAPGPGTLYLRSDTAFLRPILVGRPHRLRVRLRAAPGRAGHLKAVSTVHDASGDACLVDYAELVQRDR